MKTCLVGYTPDEGGEEALSMARSLAAGKGLQIVVCVVMPEGWGFPSLASRVDQEFGHFVDEHAQQTLDQARALMAGTADVRYEKVVAASPSAGLAQAAERFGADLIVLGSARAGTIGRLLLGGVTDELLHSAPLPVAIAPFGYGGVEPVSRVTVAYSGGESARSISLHALGFAGTLGVPLRLASFAVRDQHMYLAAVAKEAETQIVDAWSEQAQAALDSVSADIAVTGYPISTGLGTGADWDEALAAIDWLPGEVMLLGSSRLGPLQRVFLGSNAAKIIRASTVPVLVWPRRG